jgi:hypothetical protein
VYGGAGRFCPVRHSALPVKQALLLDRLLGAHWPDLGSADALKAFEAIPFAERVAARSTYAAIRLGAAFNPNAAALLCLPNADPDETAATVSYAQFIGRITQTANFLGGLGVGPNDVVSFLLPLLPHSFFTLFGAEAATKLPYVECDKDDPGRRRCQTAKIRAFPTWDYKGERREGVLELEELRIWVGAPKGAIHSTSKGSQT